MIAADPRWEATLVPSYVTAHYALSIIQLIAAIYYHQMEGVNRTGTRIVKRDIMLDKGATPGEDGMVVSVLERGWQGRSTNCEVRCPKKH